MPPGSHRGTGRASSTQLTPTATCAKPKGLSLYSRPEEERVVADAVRTDADSRSQDEFLTLGRIALPLSSAASLRPSGEHHVPLCWNRDTLMREYPASEVRDTTQHPLN